MPPTVKAVAWIWCQMKSSSVFPQFYFSGKQTHQESHMLASAMGAAICFRGSSVEGCRLIARLASFCTFDLREQMLLPIVMLCL